MEKILTKIITRCKDCPYYVYSPEFSLWCCTGPHGFSSAPLTENPKNIAAWCPLPDRED